MDKYRKSKAEKIAFTLLALLGAGMGIFSNIGTIPWLMGALMAAAGIIFLSGPSFVWLIRMAFWNQGGQIPQGDLRNKIMVFQSLCERSEEMIELVIRNHADLLENPWIQQALKSAANRGVQIEILCAETYPDLEAFLGYLRKYNSGFLRACSDLLQEWKIRLFFGAETEDEFLIFDDDALIIVNRPAKNSDNVQWRWHAHTIREGEYYAARVHTLREKMHQVSFREFDFAAISIAT